MLCVGYSDPDRIFIVRNSWGNDWGDNGYCYIPYDYLMNSTYNFNDSWIVKQLTNFDIDESTWGDDSSITGDFETELAEMTDEDYQQMLEGMGDYPLEFRIALIILNAASADGEVSDEEIEEISTYMEDTLDKLGINLSAVKIIKHCQRELKNKILLEESIELLGEYLSFSLLAKILNDIQDIIGVDDLSEEEENFVGILTEKWQIEDDEEDDSDDDDYDYEEDQ